MNKPVVKKVSMIAWIYIILLTACTEKEISIIEESQEGKTVMSFNLSQVYTGSEKTIHELDLLVFNKEGDFLYMQQAYPTDDNVIFRTTLHEGKELTIHFVVNSRDLIMESKIMPGEPWEDIRHTLHTKYSHSKKSSGYTPMWGMTYGTRIDIDKLNRFTIDLVNVII